MLYHISKTPGLTTLVPHVSTHRKAYVYALENVVLGLLFGAQKDDFDFLIQSENDTAVITECYPDAFRQIYQNKSCSIYEVPEDGFLRGMTSWSPELVCEKEVPVLREIPVPDLYARLLEEEAKGNLILHRYADTTEYKQMISRHIVDRLIRFDMVYTENSRIRQHYGKLIDALQDCMDGHLL